MTTETPTPAGARVPRLKRRDLCWVVAFLVQRVGRVEIDLTDADYVLWCDLCVASGRSSRDMAHAINDAATAGQRSIVRELRAQQGGAS